MPATLYRCPMWSNWMCPCGRVERELRKAGVSHDVVRVPYRKSRRPEVERVSGQRVVPLLVIDGEPICDSHRIVEHVRWRSRSAEAA